MVENFVIKEQVSFNTEAETRKCTGKIAVNYFDTLILQETNNSDDYVR